MSMVIMSVVILIMSVVIMSEVEALLLIATAL